jgi:hypothetical protein
MNLQPILNKNLPWAHTESEFDVLGIAEKPMKYIVYLFKRRNWKIIIFLFTSYPNSKQVVISRTFRGQNQNLVRSILLVKLKCNRDHIHGLNWVLADKVKRFKIHYIVIHFVLSKKKRPPHWFLSWMWCMTCLSSCLIKKLDEKFISFSI